MATTLAFSKSITIKNRGGRFYPQMSDEGRTGCQKVKQVVANGCPTSIYLQLPRKGDLYRLILFNETFKAGHKITLIYIESKNDSEDVLKPF